MSKKLEKAIIEHFKATGNKPVDFVDLSVALLPARDIAPAVGRLIESGRLVEVHEPGRVITLVKLSQQN